MPYIPVLSMRRPERSTLHVAQAQHKKKKDAHLQMWLRCPHSCKAGLRGTACRVCECDEGTTWSVGGKTGIAKYKNTHMFSASPSTTRKEAGDAGLSGNHPACLSHQPHAPCTLTSMRVMQGRQ